MKISLPQYLFLLEVLEAPHMCCLCFSVRCIKDQRCQKPVAFFLVNLTIDLSLTSFPPINPYLIVIQNRKSLQELGTWNFIQTPSFQKTVNSDFTQRKENQYCDCYALLFLQ